MAMDGMRMLIALLIGIALLLFLVMKTKVQAFLALILSSIVIGVIGGMPLTATDLVNAAGEAKTGVSLINSITGGFGGTLGVSEAKDQLKVWAVTSTIAWAIGAVEVLLLSLVMR